jgi:hypothetical protein
MQEIGDYCGLNDSRVSRIGAAAGQAKRMAKDKT